MINFRLIERIKQLLEKQRPEGPKPAKPVPEPIPVPAPVKPKQEDK